MPLLAHSLDFECPIDFTEPQRASLSTEYPLKPDAQESPNEFAIRRYLETLWLPESLMPLPYLIHSLWRMSQSEIVEQVPPLLRTSRATQDKYHKELLQILQDNGGAGEIEETMMWYAWSHEKVDGEEGKGMDDEDDEAWRKKWLDQLEKRETQIQILLHMLLISTPNSPPKLPPPSASSSPRKPSSNGSPRKRRRFEVEEEEPDPTLDDHLETLMDKLCVWQLVNSLDVIDPDNHENDWVQEFCVNVVEPLFKKELPVHSELLRSKVFPHDSIPDSPDSDPPQPMKRSLSRALSRGPSMPQSRALSREPSLPPITGRDALTREKSSGDLFGVSRTRSRSRSIAEESKPGAKVQARTGVSSSVNPYEVTFRRSLSKPALDFDGGKTKALNPVIARARSPPRKSKTRPRSGSSASGTSQQSQLAPMTLALETPPRGLSQLSQPSISKEPLYQSPPDPLDFFKSDDGLLGEAEILAVETPVKPIKSKFRRK